MSSENGITSIPDQVGNEKRPVQLPKILTLFPTGWQPEVYCYDHGREFLLTWDGESIQVTPEGMHMGISSPLSGWKLKVFRKERAEGVEVKTCAKYCEGTAFKERFLVDNIWRWEDAGYLRLVEAGATSPVELCSEPVAIIPVPRALEPRGQGEGGVIVATHDSLHHGPSIKEIGKFLRLRSWR